MMRRIVAAGLWALAIYSGGQLASGILGAPWYAGPVLAIAVAAFVLVDPTKRIWAAPPTRRIARIPESTHPSDAQTAGLTR